MNFFQAVLMGIVQGLSEFLPISSSAHLVFTSNFYKVIKGIEIAQQSNEEVFLDIMLHFGTLIAVLIFFRKDIFTIIKAFCKRDFKDPDAKTGLYIVIGTVITVILALPLQGIAEKLVFAPAVTGLLLIITGIVLLVSEKISANQVSKPLNFRASIWIALAQGLAVLPGLSRSGWTIAAGLFRGISRVDAAKYSFLLSIPIILGASMLYPVININLHEALSYNWKAIIAGTVVSGITGYLCIKYFIKFVSKFSLAVFGYYCIIVGIITAIFFDCIK